MIKHLIFDFDGTISDSYPVFVRVVKEVAEEFGFPVIHSDEELFTMLHVNTKYCMDQMGIDQPPAVRGKVFWKYQQLHYREFKAFDEIEPILKKAISLGKCNYIYTHTGDVVHDILKNMGLHHYFSGIVTASQGFLPKPAPDALHYLCNTYGLDPSECLMIGDRDIDTKAGNNAGIKGCLWDAYGVYPDYQTDYKIKTLAELNALLERI